VAEAQRADQQARHDLVADAEQGGGLEHAVAQRNRGRERDRVAAEQRQVHAGLALASPRRTLPARRRHLRRRAASRANSFICSG
jgi:hypothetical protein